VNASNSARGGAPAAVEPPPYPFKMADQLPFVQLFDFKLVEGAWKLACSNVCSAGGGCSQVAFGAIEATNAGGFRPKRSNILNHLKTNHLTPLAEDLWRSTFHIDDSADVKKHQQIAVSCGVYTARIILISYTVEKRRRRAVVTERICCVC
jgi:hypothetical protein